MNKILGHGSICATGAAPHAPRTPKCSSHCFPHPHWLCPSSTEGSSQPCLSSSTPLPPAIIGQAASPCPLAPLHHPAPRRQKSQLLLLTWRTALPFWVGKKLFVFGCPSTFMRKVWPPMSQCFMGLESPTLERWRKIFHRSM